MNDTSAYVSLTCLLKAIIIAYAAACDHYEENRWTDTPAQKPVDQHREGGHPMTPWSQRLFSPPFMSDPGLLAPIIERA